MYIEIYLSMSIWGCRRHFFSTSVNVLFLWLMLILPFPGKLLSPSQSQTQSAKTPISHLGGARLSHRAPSDRLLPERDGPSCWRCSSWEEGSTSSHLSQGEVPLCGGETPLCWAVCSAHVWTLVSQLYITLYLSSVEEWGDAMMNCTLCCLLFCPTFAC